MSRHSAISALLALCALTLAALALAQSTLVPYTFYQLELQDNFAKNSANVKGTPYEPYFKPDLYVYPEMIEPGRTPIDCETQAMKGDFSDINTLLAPPSVELPNENAWCSYPDGQGYVASRTHFPNVTADMINWWFWWHSAESVRYSLWHPWAHVSISSDYTSKFGDASLNDTQKRIGSTHHITEIIGEVTETIDIHWKNASYFGLNVDEFPANKIVADACGEIVVGGSLKAVDMIHLWYDTGSGLELRSRYFLGNNVTLTIPVLGQVLPVEQVADALGIKQYIVGRELSYLQFHHDQQEMTHLASVLPDIYHAFSGRS